MPMAEFVERAVVVSPVLSPDGRFLAVAKTSDDRAKTVVAVIELDAPNTSRHDCQLEIRFVPRAPDDRHEYRVGRDAEHCNFLSV